MGRWPFKLWPVLVIFLLFTASCAGDKYSRGSGNMDSLEYARLLSIEGKEGYDLVRIRSPFDSTALLASYALVPDSIDPPADLPDDVKVLRVPLKSVTLYTDVHGHIIDELGAVSMVSCVIDAPYFKTRSITDGIASGKIADAGLSGSPSVEKIISTSPQALIVSVYEGMDLKGIDKLGIPVIYMADNMEATPLGRAEWIKFIGSLTGERSKADSIFSEVSDNYHALTRKVAKAQKRPKVLTETMYQGVWYVPAGESYQKIMLEDAGGKYPWADTGGSGSLNLSFEEVIDKSGDADVWLIRTFGRQLTKDALLADDDRYRHFNAFENGEIWIADTSVSGLFEEFPFHPERLLSDYIIIFHPELSDSLQLRYYQKIAK